MGPLARWLEQVVSITWFGLRTIPRRKGSAAAAIAGIAGVVAVLVGVLSIAQGIQRTMQASGSRDAAVVLRDGASSEMMSGLSREQTRIVADKADVARGDSGPLASAELFVVINLPKRTTGTDANVPLRGVERAAFEVRDDLEIVEGRRFQWGRSEVIVGDGAAREFAGLRVGEEIEVGGEPWKIVGRFVADGGIAESEIWTDASLLQSAYRRGDSFQAVHVRLESADAFDSFVAALEDDPRLGVDVVRQADFYAEQASAVTTVVTVLGTLVAALMGIGAIFGALNTMYSAVSARTREIATLRALGFGSVPVVISILVEALVLASIGGIVGGGAAWLAFDGLKTATLNWQSFSQMAFAFAVTPELLVRGGVYACLIGLVGGLFPAIRAARIPVVQGLREA